MKKNCNKYLKKIDKTIKSIDISYSPSHENLHFDDDISKITYLGSLLTLIVFGYVAFIGYIKA